MRTKVALLFLICLFMSYLSAQQCRPVAPRIIQLDGKFGLADEHGNVLPAKYDKIYSTIHNYENLCLVKVNPVFIIKQNDGKYGLAYSVDMDSLFTNEMITNEWYVSDLKYDSIVYLSYYDQFSYFNERFGRHSYCILKYKLDGKWGLIYVPTIRSKYSDNPLESSSIPSALGYMRMTEPFFDKIKLEEKLYPRDYLAHLEPLHGFHNVKINGKWRIAQVICEHTSILYDSKKPAYKPKLRMHLYDAIWDSIPRKYIRNKSEHEYCFKVFQDSLAGVVCCDIVTQKEELVFPYMAIKPNDIRISEHGIYYSENNKVMFHDGDSLYIIALQKPYCGEDGGGGGTIKYEHFDGVGDRKFVLLVDYSEKEKFGKVGMWTIKSIALYEQGKLIREFNEPNCRYLTHHYEYGLLIEKICIQGKNYVHEYYDFETEKVVFTISYRKSSTHEGKPKVIKHELKYARDSFEPFTYYDRNRKYSKTYIIGYYNPVRKEFVEKLPK